MKSPIDLNPRVPQRVPQLVRSNKSESVGRGQRSEVEAAAEVDEGERRLPRADDHRGAYAERRDGRVVQPREEDGQERGIRRDQAAHQRRDQRRGEGGALSRAVHLPARESLPQPVREERRRGGSTSGERGRCLEGVLRSTWRGTRRRVRHEIRHREYLPSNDVSRFIIVQWNLVAHVNLTRKISTLEFHSV